VDYFKDLKKRFGEGKERKTEIRVFDNINASKVIIANEKLYVDFNEGFIGYKLKKGDYVEDCSEIDDVILFFDTGKMMVTKIADKKFVGKGIVHAAVWKRGDKRTIYHLIYKDGKTNYSYMKRFYVNSITRDREYDLTTGKKGSKMHYFSCHPNGESEIVTIHLKTKGHVKRLKFDVDFGEQLIKGRTSKGNIVSKHEISKVVQKEVGDSTLAARKIWYDEIVGRLNDEKRGKYLGQFKGDDKILTLYKNGEYRLSGYDLTTHFADDMLHVEKWNPEHAISAVYYDVEKEMHYAKRFLCEITTDRRVPFIPEEAELNVVSTAYQPEIKIDYNKQLKETKTLPDKLVRLDEFIEVKGMKAIGNQLEKLRTRSIELTHPIEGNTPWPGDDEDLDMPEADEPDTTPDDEANDVENEIESTESTEKEVPEKSEVADKPKADANKEATKATLIDLESIEPAEKPKPKARSLSRKVKPVPDKKAEEIKWDLFNSDADKKEKE
ncbi:MAG TPA: hypothetical protein VKX31_07140, partial [Brumimicrobium sp.]|nr:hypothetical protein [Brumimicrobium sp.]